MKTRYRNHSLCFTLSVIFALSLLAVSSAAAMHQMDQRSVAVGPDGITYIITQRMDMMGGGMDDRGMELTLYAIAQDDRILWSYRLEEGEPTAPVVGADSTVYFTHSPMHSAREGDNGSEPGKSKLYAVRGGSLKWSFEFERGLPSVPALGPGGTIYITTNCSMMQGNHDSDDMDMCEQNEKVALFALEDRQASAGLLWSRELDAMMLSEPAVQVKSATEWTISVSGLSPDNDGMGGGMMMGVPVLFRFRPDGSFQTIRLGRGGHM
ncbi:MAG: hypothetical protein HY314_11200 [Acidobacteria bacterium]|nr:hypothetical protein [Acidobacteriota bacterium]